MHYEQIYLFSEDRLSNVNVNNNSFPLAIFLYLFRLYQSRDIVHCVLLHSLVLCTVQFLYFYNTPHIYSCRHHHHHRFDCTDVCIIIVCLLICNCIIGWCKRNVVSVFFSHAVIYCNYAERCLSIFLNHTLRGLAYF
jgi:hypothetical protein